MGTEVDLETALTFQSYGSQQLRLFRRAIRDGKSIQEAADLGDYSLKTAELIAADDLKNPPPPEAFDLLYDPDAPAAASSQPKEASMAKDDDGPEEYQRPDAAKAFDIYDKQLKPKEAHLATIKGDMSEPYQAIKDQAHFPRKVLNFIIGLENIDDDAKRDHFLLALADGLKHRKLFLPRDLVTLASDQAGADIVLTEDRAPSDDLVTLDDEDEDDDIETDADEAGETPAVGTGAAAIAAMNRRSRQGQQSGAVAH